MTMKSLNLTIKDFNKTKSITSVKTQEKYSQGVGVLKFYIDSYGYEDYKANSSFYDITLETVDYVL